MAMGAREYKQALPSFAVEPSPPNTGNRGAEGRGWTRLLEGAHYAVGLLLKMGVSGALEQIEQAQDTP